MYRRVLAVGPVSLAKRFLTQTMGYAAIRARYTMHSIHFPDFVRAIGRARVKNCPDRAFRSVQSSALNDLGLHRLSHTSLSS